MGDTVPMRATAQLFLLTISVAYMGCGDDPRPENPAETGSAGQTQGTTPQGSSGGQDPTTGSSGVSDETSTGAEDDTSGGLILDVAPVETGGSVEIAEVFGHSGNTLYRLDPETLEVEVIGEFDGCDEGSIIDIALDKDSQMFGVGFEELYSIDRMTGDCTLVASGQYPTSLSFVPEGTVDPDEEALVGFVADEYVRIDVETGAISTLGTLSDGLRSSGDVVSVADGATYLTVEGPGCEDTDCIIEFDPSNGVVLENYGPIPYDEVFGLAFWAGKAYGFARNGDVFEVEFLNTGVITMLIPIPGAPSGLEFFGAGSTTSAPPVAG